MQPDPAILASPDDDAPRLVWADAVGGERGELVVVQCGLARTEGEEGADPVERKRLVRRERELLRKNGDAWAALPEGARGEFRRGFVERVIAPLATLTRRRDAFVAPLAREFHVLEMTDACNRWTDPSPPESWRNGSRALFDWLLRERPLPILGLRLRPAVDQSDSGGPPYDEIGRCGDDLLERLAETPVAATLASISLDASGLSASGVSALRRFPALRSLHVAETRLGPGGGAWLLSSLPTIRHLSLSTLDGPLHGEDIVALLAAPGIARLSSLGLRSAAFDASDPGRIAACRSLEGLRSLALHADGSALPAGAIEALARAPSLAGLRSLSLQGAALAEDAMALLARAPFAERLRTLDLTDAAVGRGSFALLASSFPALERLDLTGVHGIAAEEAARLEEAIPDLRGVTR